MALCNLPARYPWEREGTGGPHAGCTDDEGKGIKGKVGGRGKGRRPRHEGRGHSGMREHRRPCVRGGTGGEADAARCVPGSGGGAFDLKDGTSSSEPGGHSLLYEERLDVFRRIETGRPVCWVHGKNARKSPRRQQEGEQNNGMEGDAVTLVHDFSVQPVLVYKENRKMGYRGQEENGCIVQTVPRPWHYNKERSTICGTAFLSERAPGKHGASEEPSATP